MSGSQSPEGGSGRFAAVLIVGLLLALAAGRAVEAQTSTAPAPAPGEAAQTPAETPSQAADDEEADSGDEAQPEEPRRFFDSVTVSATLNPMSIKDTPSTVSVIDAETIERRLIENIADLVKFEPGVYIDSNPTRVGLNGFNIRGIGGNRVMTQVDGIETAEQFDFGPFNVHRYTLDLDTLKSAEIVRSSGSSLYGSDALGGVVSLFTKDPADYLANQAFHLGGKALFDSRASDTSGNAVVAGARGRVQASLFAGYAYGHELDNQGDVRSQDETRTAPNPQDRRGAEALGKVVVRLGDGNLLRGTVEYSGSDVDTTAYSSLGLLVQGPIVTDIADVTADDTSDRTRLSVDQTLVGRGGLNEIFWNLYVQTADVGQVVDEVRTTMGAGPPVTLLRRGTLDFEQDGVGGSVQGRKLVTPGGRPWLLTFGGSAKRSTFDMIRDRLDVNAVTGAEVPAGLILPSKYFPKSQVGEAGAYVQAEIEFGRVTLVPGLRYDHFSLDADETDPVYLASLNPTPADFSAGALSSRVGLTVGLSEALTLRAQYAGGFRAPPYSAVNSGFTNLAGGYTSLPNPDLDPETSDNFEVGLRTAVGRVGFGATVFSNHYDDFIEQAVAGFNPATGLLEFQYQNVSKVRISGLELQGDARLSDTLWLRASYALIRGNDVTAEEDVPLGSIAPDQAALGLQYQATSGRWGSELSGRLTAGQPEERAGDGLYAPSAYGVMDLTGWVSLTPSVTLRGAVLNLTDATYFEWPYVRGRPADDRTIDRYSSPGISGLMAVSYGW